VVGFFGFKHDRKLALKALAVAAARNDTHSVFAGSVNSVSLFWIQVSLKSGLF